MSEANEASPATVGSEVARVVRRFPFGCRIVNIKRGTGPRHCYVYAQLLDINNELLISATLDYITEQLLSAEIESA